MSFEKRNSFSDSEGRYIQLIHFLNLILNHNDYISSLCRRKLPTNQIYVAFDSIYKKNLTSSKAHFYIYNNEYIKITF